MNIKKLLVLISALVVVVAFVGCASQQEVANSDSIIKNRSLTSSSCRNT